MPEGTAVNTIFSVDLIKRVDDYGKNLMASAFNARTKRGRSAVIRQLVIAGLRAEAGRLATVKKGAKR